MTLPNVPKSDITPKTKLIGILMIVFGFSCLLFDLLLAPSVPQSLGVAVFCFSFVYGLAKLRNK